MRKNQNLIRGKLGEEIACRYLMSLGYEILLRNYHKSYAEIDIVAGIDDLIVIVEVKTRRFNPDILAREAVNLQKQNKIIKLTKEIVSEYHLYDYDIRFDIIECYWDTRQIVHIENAFEV